MPNWIKDLIIPIYQPTGYVSFCDVTFAGQGIDHTEKFILRKLEDNSIRVTNPSYTSTRQEFGRIEYDLLIDNE